MASPSPTPDQLLTALRNADQAGDTAGAARIAQLYKQSVSAPNVPPPGTGGAPGPKLGPGVSGLVRAPLEAATGIVTGIPDMAIGVGNYLGNLIDKAGQSFGAPAGFMGPDVKPLGQSAQEVIDKYTTPPTSTLGRVGEEVDSIVMGALGGPKMPHVPRASPGVQRLASEGVTMTPGQRAGVGSVTNYLEQTAGKVLPWIKTARAKAVEQWNNARLNESLKDAGAGTLPKDLTGRDAIKHTYQKLGERYDATLTKMRADLNKGTQTPPPNAGALPAASATYNGQPVGVRVVSPPTPAPGSFREAVENVRKVGQNLDASQRGTLNDIIDNQVLGKFTQAGKASGETIKEIEETLRTEAENLESGGYQDRKLSSALYQLRADLKTTLQRQNPKLASQLEDIDRGYAKYKLSARASNARPTGSGNYTPGQRLQAAKARDTSKDKNAFSTGTARGQAEAQEAQGILGNTEPDSGTPAGMSLLSLLGAGGAGVAGHSGLIPAMLAAPAVYNQPVLNFLQKQSLNMGPEMLSKIGAVLAGNQSLQDNQR